MSGLGRGSWVVAVLRRSRPAVRFAGLFGILLGLPVAALSQTYDRMYGRAAREPFEVPALNVSRLDPVFLRTRVTLDTSEPPGTIIVDPARHFLYFVEGGGRAIRYGIGVGRQGFSWSGTAEVRDKQEWPDWYPPKEMLERQPELLRSMGALQSGIGMPGGPRNPLGARALYLWKGNKDTLYRIHGTVEPWTIGTNVSSGCIRMINRDVIDLYDRVPLGAKVIVLSTGRTSPPSTPRRPGPRA